MYLGRSGIDAPFNMGVAFGLLYLIVASKNEMTKMVELRKEMEMLLQNLKEESRGKSCSLKVFENNDSSANSCLTTDAREVSNSNISHLPDSENIVVCDEYESSSSSSKCVTREQAICSVGMNELELELEAELQRLQLHLDMDSSLNHPQKQRMKVCDFTISFPFSYGVMEMFWLLDILNIFNFARKLIASCMLLKVLNFPGNVDMGRIIMSNSLPS